MNVKSLSRLSHSPSIFYCLSCSLTSVLFVDFTTDIFPVPEDNGTVTVCLRTSTGSQEELVINVTATIKTTGSDLACKLVCVLSTEVLESCVFTFQLCEYCLQLLMTLFLRRLP